VGRRRIEVNRDLPPARLPARLLNEMRAHALESLPEECCGLLVGPSVAYFEEVHRCRNDMTRLHRQDPTTYPRDGRRAFHMAEVDYARIQTSAEQRGGLVTGVYHSHVEAAAYFSEMDQQFVCQPGFPFPDAEHLVLSVVEDRVREIAVFRRIPGAPGFEGRLVRSEAA
jgi:proteasome lid subunit RPN8/RPN11